MVLRSDVDRMASGITIGPSGNSARKMAQPSRQLRPTLARLCIYLLVVAASSAEGSVLHQRHKHRRSWHYASRTPLTLLNRARVVTGDDSRMLRVVDKLLRGEPVVIAWLGTSLSMAYYGIPRGASMAWPYIFHRWLEMTFTSCGDPEHNLPPVMEPWGPYEANRGHVCGQSTINMTNLSVFATTPNFMESCKLHKIPRNVDLVLLEMAVNDGFNTQALGSPSRRALERIIRYVLKMPTHPALLMFETYSWRHASRMEPPEHTGPEFKQTVERYRRFAYLAEDDHMVLAQYYGNVQVLAARPVVYHTIMAHPEKRFLDLFMIDDIHLAEPGHILYADILITYFRQHARSLGHHLIEFGNALNASDPAAPSSPTEAAGAAAAGAQDGGGMHLSHPEQHARAALLHAERPFGYLFPAWQTPSNYSYVQENYQDKLGVMYTAPLEPWLPPPLNRNNLEVDQGMCHYGPDLKPFVVESDGFVFMDESNSNRDKFGYVAMEVGKRLVLRVDASLGGINKHVQQSSVNILHLESYEGMGWAEARCIRGCTCEPQQWDSQCERKWSYTYPMTINVTPHPECHLEIRTIAAPDNRTAHKVKIIGVAVMGGERMMWDLDFSLSIERYERSDQLT